MGRELDSGSGSPRQFPAQRFQLGFDLPELLFQPRDFAILFGDGVIQRQYGEVLLAVQHFQLIEPGLQIVGHACHL